MRSLLFATLLVTGLCSAQSVDVLPLSELEAKFEQSLAEALAPIEKERAALVEGYSRVVENSLKAFQEKADLDKVLQAREELELVQEKGEVGRSDFPELEEVRNTFRKRAAEIGERARSMEIQMRKKYVTALNRYEAAKTKSGEIDSALEYSNESRAQMERIVELKSHVAIAEKPVLESLKVVDGNAVYQILKKRDATVNVVREASTIEASSSHPRRDLPTSLLKKTRGDDMDEYDPMDVWCLEIPRLVSGQGWLRVTWKTPVVGQEILMVNRPHPHSQDDLWTRGQISINGTLVSKIEDFGRGEVAILKLEAPVAFEELFIEILEGTWSPGLYSLEVYPPQAVQP